MAEITWPVGSLFLGESIEIRPNLGINFPTPSGFTVVGEERVTGNFIIWQERIRQGENLPAAVDEATFRTPLEPNASSFRSFIAKLNSELGREGGFLIGAKMWKKRVNVTIWPDNINLFGVTIPLPGPKLRVPTPVWEVKVRTFHDVLPLIVIAQFMLVAAVLAFAGAALWLVATDRAEVIGTIISSPFRGATQSLLLFVAAGAVFSFAIFAASRAAGGTVSPPSPPPIAGVPTPSITVGPPSARIQTGIRGGGGRRPAA